MAEAIQKALLDELKRQYDESGPYGALHYFSPSEDGKVQLEGGIDLEAMAKVAEQAQPLAKVSVKTMHKSGGEADYFVAIDVGDREVTPHVFTELYKAEYHVALYDWLLNGKPKPDLLAYGPKGEEQVYLYDCGRGQGSVLATSLEQARMRAKLDAGASDPATNVRLATDGELAVRKAMGGSNA